MTTNADDGVADPKVAGVLALLRIVRPKWELEWQEGGGGYWHLWSPEHNDGACGFSDGQGRAVALLRAVERAHAKGWR